MSNEFAFLLLFRFECIYIVAAAVACDKHRAIANALLAVPIMWNFTSSILLICFLLFSFLLSTVSASQRDSSSSKDNKADAYGKNALDLDAFKIGPYFDKMASKNVTALLGKTAYLNCRVKNLGNKTASITTLS